MKRNQIWEGTKNTYLLVSIDRLFLLAMDSDMARRVVDRCVIVPHNRHWLKNGWLKYDHRIMYKKYTAPCPIYGMGVVERHLEMAQPTKKRFKPTLPRKSEVGCGWMRLVDLNSATARNIISILVNCLFQPKRRSFIYSE